MERIEAERNRTVQRALLMAKGDYGAIRAHPELSRPLAGGATHSHPEEEERMHRDYDRRAYATLEELEAYDTFTRALNEKATRTIREGMAVKGSEEQATEGDDGAREALSAGSSKKRAAVEGEAASAGTSKRQRPRPRRADAVIRGVQCCDVISAKDSSTASA